MKEIKHLQKLLVKEGFDLVVDGMAGDATRQAVIAFQKQQGLTPDGIAGRKTWAALNRHKKLSEANYQHAADLLDVDIATIKAVKAVESRGDGFFRNGHPAILYERHVMHRRLKVHGIDPNQYAMPGLINRKPGGYLGGLKETERLRKAMRVHEEAALESCSWGLFQIMGYHWRRLGYQSIDDFVERMYKSEAEQLNAFVRFIKTNGLARFLRGRQWADFARSYNGKAYKKNRYDEKLARAYRKYNKTEASA